MNQTESIGCQTGASLNNTSEMSEDNGENDISADFNPSLSSTPKTRQDMVKKTRGLNSMSCLRMKDRWS